MARRNTYNKEFKIAAIKLVTEQKYTVAKAARSVGVSDQSIQNWIDRFTPDEDTGQLVDLEAENRKLREELRQVREEREILKKATAFFAGEKA